MQQLDALARQAAELANSPLDAQPGRAGGAPSLAALGAAEGEVARQMQICNACRYCEGFCAVFPAMTRRLEFGHADVHYLANLCHNCGACYHACQYAPPHEFAVNVPLAMARVRAKTYADFAWPRALGTLYSRNGLTLALALAGSLALFLVLAIVSRGALFHAPLEGNFYAVFPHNTLVAMFGAVFGFSMLALAIGAARFWREAQAGAAGGAASMEAARNVLTLKYLDGGHGQGCNEADDRFTLARRRFHHLTFYGFLLCFASTSVATLFHYALGLPAPYALTSLPVLLGTLGGIGLLIGPAGLLGLNLRRQSETSDAAQHGMDRAFTLLLWLSGASGLALLAWRDSGAMALWLAVHLGAVMALFLTLPYGKFAHAIYRSAALLKWAIERRQPNPVAVACD